MADVVAFAAVGSEAMADINSAFPKQLVSQRLPLFYRKKVGINGESEEISLGPCVVRVIALVIFFLLSLAFILSGRQFRYCY